MQNVLITGISGSVGHYVLDLLKDDPRFHLYLVVRKPQNIKRDLSTFKNVTLIQEDIRKVHTYHDILRTIDYAVLIATSWGGFKEPWRINVYATFRLLRRMDKNRLKKVIYFSTASILDREHKPVEAIREIGTNYIRSKFLTHKMFQYHPLKDKITILYPTWVYGGGKNYPWSHAATGLPKLKPWIGFAQYFTFDFSFHFIHCADIAQMVVYMLDHDLPKRDYVLGNEVHTVGDFLRGVAAYYGHKPPLFQLKIPMGLIQFLGKLGRKHPWDAYCMQYRHFNYDVLNCQKLGIPTTTDTVVGMMKNILEN